METSRAFRWFSLWTALVTFAIVVMGGVVRVTGSGDACPDWPLCHGTIIPPFEVRIWIEWTHRLIAAVASPSILALALWVSARYRRDRLLFRSMWLAVGLLVFQIVLGGMVVLFGLPGALVGIHLANALLIWSAVLLVSLFAHRPWRTVIPRNEPRLLRLIVWSALGVYALIFSGTVVTGMQYNIACNGWPLCSGGLLPASLPQAINITHRYVAAAIGVVLMVMFARVWRASADMPVLRRALLLALALFLAQVTVGALNVLSLFNPFWNALHLMLAAATWGGIFVLLVVAWQCLGARTPEPVRTGVTVGQPVSTASSRG